MAEMAKKFNSLMYDSLLKIISENYREGYYKGDKCFFNRNNIPFTVDTLKKWNAIVISFLDNGEDGDGFFLEDFQNPLELYNQVAKGIDFVS